MIRVFEDLCKGRLVEFSSDEFPKPIKGCIRERGETGFVISYNGGVASLGHDENYCDM